MKRYDFVTYTDGSTDIEAIANGEYVLWSDVEPLLPRWVSVEERLPEIPDGRGSVTVYALTAVDSVIALDWETNKYAATDRGRQPRWKWRGRLAPWHVTHWLEFQLPTLPPLPSEAT